MTCSRGPLTDAILFAPRNNCPVGRSGHAITIGTMLRLLDHGAAPCLDLDLVRGACPGCGATYWHGRDGHEDEATGYWTCGADGCPGAMPADWPGPACGGRVAWVPVSHAGAAGEGGVCAVRGGVVSAPKLTREQRAKVRSLMDDEGWSRAEAVAWVLAFKGEMAS